MNRIEKIGTAALTVSIALLVGFELVGPEPTDWRPNYESTSTKPFGAQILYNMLGDIYPGQPVKSVTQPLYRITDESLESAVNYLIITEVFATDPASTRRLLDFVREGHSVLVAAHSFRGPFADTAGVGVETIGFERVRHREKHIPPTTISFVNPRLPPPRSYRFPAGEISHYFDEVDTARTTVLAVNENDEPVFIRRKLGRGQVFLLSTPLLFTNYYLLRDDNATFAYKALSYLPVQGVLWDSYQKPFADWAESPLSFVLGNPPLQLAFYLALAWATLFAVFQGKRRQRALPVRKPPENHTAEFVKRVSQLYRAQSSNRDISEKKIVHLRDYLRSELNVRPDPTDPTLKQQIVRRGNVSPERADELLAAMQKIDEVPDLSDDQMRRIHEVINRFYRQCDCPAPYETTSPSSHT